QVPENEAVGVAGFVGHGDPDVLDDTGAFDLPQEGGRPGLDLPDTGGALPRGPQMAGGHAAPALLPPGVFGVDGPAFSAGDEGQAAQAAPQEILHTGSSFALALSPLFAEEGVCFLWKPLVLYHGEKGMS